MRHLLRAIVAMCLSFLAYSAQAQTFTPIFENYACGEFPNGKHYLVKQVPNGYILVKSSVIKDSIKKQRNILKQRISLLKDSLKEFEKSRLAKSKLISITNKIIQKIFGGDQKLPNTLPPDEAESAVMNVVQNLKTKDNTLKIVQGLIGGCESGINPSKKGTVVGVSVSPIAVATSTEIIGGFVVFGPKLKNVFSTKPGGYNVCLKVAFPDGSVSKLYTGFGDEGFCGPGRFAGLSPAECKALIPTRQVGYLMQKRTYAFTSLPDATTAELLDRMRLEVLQDQPIVGVMAFLANTSRDSDVKGCEAF